MKKIISNELKFKAYNKDLGMSESMNFYEAAIMFMEGCEPDAIIQFSGATDKKGIEVYEGFIISSPFENKAIGVITRGEYGGNIGFYVNWISGMHKDLLRKNLAYWASISEIIGNIFENPELLEV